MADRYADYASLRAQEVEGRDYRICATLRASEVAVIAPHGGRIEPGTSEIAAAIAAADCSVYSFEGLRSRPHGALHIASERFDEPRCLSLIRGCAVVVAVHGLHSSAEEVQVGGLDLHLRDAICAELEAAGFRSTIAARGKNAGRSPHNICNRGSTRKGVQLEITRGLRDALVDAEERLTVFAGAVRQAVLTRG